MSDDSNTSTNLEPKAMTKIIRITDYTPTDVYKTFEDGSGVVIQRSPPPLGLAMGERLTIGDISLHYNKDGTFTFGEINDYADRKDLD